MSCDHYGEPKADWCDKCVAFMQPEFWHEPEQSPWNGYSPDLSAPKIELLEPEKIKEENE